jgi:hypothetical protein
MLICKRCGYADDSGFIARRRERKQAQLCQSCVARPSREVKTEYGICRPHRGNFDGRDRPMDRWHRLFRPGHRLCGNADCVEPTHIVSDPDLLRG